MLTELRQAEQITRIFACMGVAISSAEFLYNKALLSRCGLLDWNIFSLHYSVKKSHWLWMLVDFIFSPEQTMWMLRLRLLAAVVLMLIPLSASLRSGLSLFILLLSILLLFRNSFGSDGADQMTLILFAALSIANAEGDNAPSIAFAFVAAQCILAYFIAGITKLGSPVWRSGEAVPRILSTETYGLGKVGHLIGASKRIALFLSWGVILFECLFAFCLFLSPTLFYCALAIGVLFHVANAMIMGLNTFFWAFVGCYPSIVFIKMRFFANVSLL
jgi:hypothetical protein